MKSRTTARDPLDFENVEIQGIDQKLFVLVDRAECYETLERP